MPKLVFLATLVFLTATRFASAESEPLNPAFEDESLRDPFLTPAAQISGPLDGEDPSEDWYNGPVEYYFPAAPGEVFGEPEDDSCTTTVSPTRRIPLYDNGVTATWLGPVEGFGISDVDIRSSLVMPLFVQGSPLRLTMSGGVTFVDAPRRLDVPDRLYGLAAELRWYIPFKETWGVDLGLGGAVYSDLNGSAGRGFRMTGRAILVKDLNPQWKLSGGILYLGRKNLLAMPIAGAIYTPQDDFKVEILIPRPRVLKRIRYNGIREHWIYGGLEIFGGNTWAITQSTGAEDTFIYKDNRLLIGYETKAKDSISARFEAGYVFMREVEFEDDPTSFDPNGTIMVRAGVTY